VILKDFFNFYFDVVDDDVLQIYNELLPEADELAAAYEEVFARNDENAIAFLLDFHNATARLKEEKPEQAILFNVANNVCFPFFVEYIWNVISDGERKKLVEAAGSSELEVIVERLREDRDLRNWFRCEIGSSLSQEDLFTLNEIIALQNFSSGGEYSFLKYVYPHIQQSHGKILDAGCGAGFASLVMSQYVSVHAIDACKARLERAMALSAMMKKGDKKVFPRVIQLIEDELGTMAVQCEFPAAEELLIKGSQPVNFVEGTIANLPYQDNSFESINCLDVLEHTYDPNGVIAEFARVLKPGGRVFITAPTRYGEVEQRIWENIEGTLFPAMLHMHHFDPESLTRLFAKHGLKEVEITHFDFMSWDDFLEIAERSPDRELAEELQAHPFDQVALQLFAVYEKE